MESGYFSTFTYNKSGLISYLVYQYIQSIGKITILVIYIVTAISPEYRNVLKNNNIFYIIPTPGNIVVISFATLAQIYITYFIQHFYNLMPKGRSALLNP